jgi:MFS family permease
LSLFSSWRELGQLPLPLWLLAGANFLNRCGTMVVAFLALYFVRRHQLDLETAGWLVACYSWGSLASAPTTAWLCERLDACHVLALSLISSGLAMLAFPALQGMPAWALGCFGLGLLAEIGRPAGYTALGRLVTPEQMRQAFTLNRLAVNLGMSVGPALGGWLALHSYEWLFWADGATSVLAGTVVLVSGLRSPGQPAAIADAPAPGRLFYRYLLGHFLGMLVFVQLFTAMPLYLVDVLHWKETFSGWMFTLNTGLILLLEAWITQRTGGWRLSRAIALGYLCEGLGFGLFAIAPDPRLVVAGVTLFSLGEMLQSSANGTYLNRMMGGRLLGRANAWFVGVGSTAFILAPPTVGWTLEHFGATTLWSGICLLGVMASLLAASLPHR